MRRIRLPDHVLCADTPPGAVLLDTRANQYFALNRTAAELVRRLTTAPDPDDVLRQLSRTLAVPHDRLAADAAALIDDLLARRLIEEDPEAWAAT